MSIVQRVLPMAASAWLGISGLAGAQPAHDKADSNGVNLVFGEKSTQVKNARGWSGTIKPVGPGEDKMRDDHAKLSAALRKSRAIPKSHKIYSIKVEYEKTASSDMEPSGYRAHVLDEDNQAYFVTAPLSDPSRIQVERTSARPNPDNEEFKDAVSVLKQDAYFGPYLKAGSVVAYSPMPPILIENGRRLVGIGLELQEGEEWDGVGPDPAGLEHHNEIVGVDIPGRRVVRYPDGAPPMSKGSRITLFPQSDLPSCSNVATKTDPFRGTETPRTPGSWDFNLTLDGRNWRFRVVRPSASNGTLGSTVELQNVYFQNVKILTQLHAPILNVKYENQSQGGTGFDLCGPYRDWNYAESEFKPAGTETQAGNGVYLGSNVASQTILNFNTDNVGNKIGVGVSAFSDRVEIVSEIQAAWYRYVPKIVIYGIGRIVVTQGYSEVNNGMPCVCHRHHHNVYWRADFDVDGISNSVKTRTGGTEVAQNTETSGFFPSNLNNSWYALIRNPGTGKQVTVAKFQGNTASLAPEPRKSYEVADWWLLRYASGQIDDGQAYAEPDGTGTPSYWDNLLKIKIDPFKNGESLVASDMVLWYGGHWSHLDHSSPTSSANLVGFNITAEW